MSNPNFKSMVWKDKLDKILNKPDQGQALEVVENTNGFAGENTDGQMGPTNWVHMKIKILNTVL
jgi:hypothetical protein